MTSLDFQLVLLGFFTLWVSPTAYAEGGAVKNLNAWENYQPADAALGALLLGRFRAEPKPPSGGGDPALDPCPVLNDWPDKVEVEAPSPCSVVGPVGNWNSESSANGGSPAAIMGWSQACSTLGGGLVPVTTYTLPGGGHFGSSQLVPSLTGNTVQLKDCVGYVRYQIDEKVYQVPGEPDAHACEVYGSCAGTVFIQYIIRDHAGGMLAKTPYLRLFQSSFTVEDKSGLLVAQVQRVGIWNPMSKTCLRDEANKWMLKFPDLNAAGASNVFPSASDRWPLAELVTIMATRDASRLSSGLVEPSVCEMEKTGLMGFMIVFSIGILGMAALLFLRVGVGPMQVMCLDFEGRFCPRRMLRPARPSKPVDTPYDPIKGWLI
eukprot:TRINITY_DN3831_c0_g2_i1.p1 TRINITY_DN3831_c0_g2~~TRINITY_DN3831_c0_g2_i1.p1  ORF type:complete len:391 (-),score=68.67 TRINITY_DN3831_c0_g2_i1:106-1236(-)